MIRRSGGTTTTFSVVLTKDASGAVNFEVLPYMDVKKREKALFEDYAQAVKIYQEAKKENADEPKPQKPGVLVLEKMVKGKDCAESLAAKYREKYEAKLAKRQDKEDAEAAKPATEEKKDEVSKDGEKKEG